MLQDRVLIEQIRSLRYYQRAVDKYRGALASAEASGNMTGGGGALTPAEERFLEAVDAQLEG